MTGSTSVSNLFATKRGTKTHYIIEGNTAGPLLITLHGLGGSTQTFAPLLPHLPRHKYCIVSVDFEGFGKTPLSHLRLSVPDYVADLDDLITHLQGSSCPGTNEGASAQPVIIIGHSLGSIVAVQYACKKPGNVAGLALLSVGRSASHIDAVKQRMIGMAAKARIEGIDAIAELATQTNLPPNSSENLKDEVRRAVKANDPEAYARTCEAMVDESHVDPDYSKITCPTILVTGEKDVISSPQKAQEVASLIKGPVVVKLVEGAHQPILNDIDGTRTALGELFKLLRK